MARNKLRQQEFEWKTKQARVIKNMYKAFEYLVDVGRYSGTISIKRKFDLGTSIEIIIEDETQGAVLDIYIEQGNLHYSKWVNEILELTRKLEKFTEGM